MWIRESIRVERIPLSRFSGCTRKDEQETFVISNVTVKWWGHIWAPWCLRVTSGRIMKTGLPNLIDKTGCRTNIDLLPEDESLADSPE